MAHFITPVVLQHLPVQLRIRDNLIQSRILIFQGLQSAHLGGQQTPYFFARIQLGRQPDP
jgi:hypothetical protein